jgi:hypothetical protein
LAKQAVGFVKHLGLQGIFASIHSMQSLASLLPEEDFPPGLFGYLI